MNVNIIVVISDLQPADDEPEQRAKKQKVSKSIDYTWKKCKTQNSNSNPNLNHKMHNPSILEKWSDENISPIDVFKTMWDEKIMEDITYQTNIYHQQKYGKDLNATTEELFTVFGILLLSGYCPVSNLHTYINKIIWNRMFYT